MSPRAMDESTREEVEQLFILGAPRSGTTFLASLLKSTRFGTPIESQFITKYALRLGRYGNLDDFGRFERLLQDVLAERAVMQWKLDVNARVLHAQLLARDGCVRYASFVDELLLRRRSTGTSRAWGDKTPHYLGNVSVLSELFPAARYLYIVRDGRDVALSVLRKSWGANNLYAAARHWTALNAPDLALERLTEDGRLHFLRYEELSADVPGHVRSIGAFLDEPISDAEIRRLESTVKKDNSFKWKESMSAAELQVFESVAHEMLERFGYEVRYPDARLSPVRRMFYRMHDFILWLRFMFMSNVVDGFRIRFLGKEPFAE